MYGRSRMTTDPRIPTMQGRNTSCFHRLGRPRLHQARIAVRCWASRMKGELHPTRNRFLRRIFLHMDDSVNESISFQRGRRGDECGGGGGMSENHTRCKCGARLLACFRSVVIPKGSQHSATKLRVCTATPRHSQRCSYL